MIAKIIAYGRTRDEALARLRRALAETTVDHRGRRDQQELPARPARPARGHRRQRRHRLDRPGPRRGTARVAPARRRGAGRRRRSTAYEEEEAGRAPAGCSRRRTAGDRRPGTRSAARSTSSCAASCTGSTVAQIGPHRFRVGVGADGRVQTVDADARAARRATPAGCVIGDQRFRLVTATHGPVLARRGRRRHPPGQPGRGRGHALARARAGRRHPGGGRCRGGGRRAGDRAREHEDGDGAAGAVRGAGARADGGHRQPGRDRYAARAPGAAAATSRRPRPRRRRRRAADLDLPAAAATPRRTTAARPRVLGRPAQPAARASTSTPATRDATLSGYVAARAELAAAGLRPVAAETRRAARCSPTSAS